MSFIIILFQLILVTIQTCQYLGLYHPQLKTTIAQTCAVSQVACHFALAFLNQSFAFHDQSTFLYCATNRVQFHQ